MEVLELVNFFFREKGVGLGVVWFVIFKELVFCFIIFLGIVKRSEEFKIYIDI